ncbi:hypothetical protein Fmac_024111 [Flemingia macrophylla]|uniref:DUF7812 domain-containing protein n=1 Tax=Flemingia macrophylla TaxID=520843 RepID=A0ABD1LP05_9FABA
MEDAKRLYHSLSNATGEGPVLKDEDLRSVCETLFDQLNSTFAQFCSALRLRHRARRPRLRKVLENLSLVLRCCLLLTTLTHSDQKFLLLKCRFLLRILKSFLSPHLVQGDLSDSNRPFLCALLEVFADELLRHQSLRRYLMIADSVSSDCEKLFGCHFNHGDIASVLEVISTHFILSVSNEKAFENFTTKLFLRRDKDFRFPELGLVPSVMLLLDPVVLSAPKMIQAHIISIVSEAIGSGSSSEISAPDMNCYLTALQKSVILYNMHVSCLQIDGFYVELKCSYNSYPLERDQPTFESYIQQGTRNKLDQVLLRSDNSWDSYQCKMSCKTKPDLLAEYTAFLKEREYIFADSCRDVTTSILDCIIRQAFSQDATEDALYNIKESISTQDICLLASILKLMSVSLLQAIKYISNSDDSDCLKTMQSVSVREKYDFLINIINHFQQLKFCLPIQTFLYDNVMKTQQSNYKVSKSMLVHFIGLLYLSFSNGFDLLAKGCISVLMALMYLLVFEEGDSISLESLRGLSLRPCSEIPSDKSGKGARNKRSVCKVAAEFCRIRPCNLRTDSFTSYNVEDGREKTCNGEMFLNCMLGNAKKLSYYDELADFLECKTGKNYSKWLNNRQIYRQWRCQKKKDLRKNMKKLLWKSSKSDP